MEHTNVELSEPKTLTLPRRGGMPQAHTNTSINNKVNLKLMMIN